MINIYRNKIFNSKFLSLFLCLIMFSVSIGLGNFSYAQLQYATSFSTSSDLLGSGTEKDPYQITDAKHLKQMQESNKKSSCFILLRNIKVESHNPISNFSGTFDGNGFTITINKFDSSFTNMGLFGSASGATIKNVNVLYSAKVSISFSSTIDGAEVGCFGGICASATASSTKKCIIENCNNFSVNISFSSKGVAIGGIVGTATGSTEIKNCTNRSNLTMTTGRATHYGGIVGFSTNKISYCSNYGDISGTATYAGGIVGSLSADLTHCYNLSSSLDITNKTSSTCYIGGIVGKTSGEVECSTNDANIEVTTSTNVAYVGGVAGQSNGLFCLSNNGDVTLNTTGYKFWLGGISGTDSYTGYTSQLINQGDVCFIHNEFDETEIEGSKYIVIGGIIGESKSSRFSYIYSSGRLCLPLNTFEIEHKTRIFGKIGSLVGSTSEDSILCENCYSMADYSMKYNDGYYTALYPNVSVSTYMHFNVSYLGGEELVGGEDISCDLTENFVIRAFGNSTPNNKPGTNGLKVYQKSISLFTLVYQTSLTLLLPTREKFGRVYFDFYYDNVFMYQSGDDRGRYIQYASDNEDTYFPIEAEDGSALLYYWEKLKGFEDVQFSIEKIDGQDYFVRGGIVPNRDYFSPFKCYFEDQDRYHYTVNEGSLIEMDKMSDDWKNSSFGKLFRYNFDYVGPLSVVKDGNKCKFNLNLISLGSISYWNQYKDDWASYPNWKKKRTEAYGGEFVQDAYTFIEFDLDPYNTKQFASKKIDIKDIGGYFTSNFQNKNGNYYVVNFWK